MFFGSTDNDIKIIIFLLSIMFIFSIFIWKKSKNLALGVFLFSVLSNLVLYIDSDSILFDVYNLKWIVKFTLWYWPWINVVLFILLIINLIKNKYVEK